MSDVVAQDVPDTEKVLEPEKVGEWVPETCGDALDVSETDIIGDAVGLLLWASENVGNDVVDEVREVDEHADPVTIVVKEADVLPVEDAVMDSLDEAELETLLLPLSRGEADGDGLEEADTEYEPIEDTVPECVALDDSEGDLDSDEVPEEDVDTEGLLEGLRESLELNELLFEGDGEDVSESDDE